MSGQKATTATDRLFILTSTKATLHMRQYQSIVHNLLGLVGKRKSKKYCLKMQLQVLKSVLQRCISKFINLSESSYHVSPL